MERLTEILFRLDKTMVEAAGGTLLWAVLVPGPDWIRIQMVRWIRIWIRIGIPDPDLNPEPCRLKQSPIKEKNEIHVLKRSVMIWRLLLELNVLYSVLRNHIRYWLFDRKKSLVLIRTRSGLSNSLDHDLDSKCLDPNADSVNPEPRHWFWTISLGIL